MYAPNNALLINNSHKRFEKPLQIYICITDGKWEITAYFQTIPSSSTSRDAELWIPTDTKQWQQPPVITPIKSMNSQPLSLQLYLEHPSSSEPKPCE